MSKKQDTKRRTIEFDGGQVVVNPSNDAVGLAMHLTGGTIDGNPGVGGWLTAGEARKLAGALAASAGGHELDASTKDVIIAMLDLARHDLDETSAHLDRAREELAKLRADVRKAEAISDRVQLERAAMQRELERQAHAHSVKVADLHGQLAGQASAHADLRAELLGRLTDAAWEPTR